MGWCDKLQMLDRHFLICSSHVHSTFRGSINIHFYFYVIYELRVELKRRTGWVGVGLASNLVSMQEREEKVLLCG